MLKNAAVCLIGFYQKCSKFIFLPRCRFVPSCSNYAKEAILRYGVIKGTMLGLLRVLRCNPFNRNTGWDPVK